MSLSSCKKILTTSLFSSFVFLSNPVTHAFADDSMNRLMRHMQQSLKDEFKRNPVMSTEVLMSESRCRDGYLTVSAKTLLAGGCYQGNSPFATCSRSIPNWKAVEENTNRNCLQIWKDTALNSVGVDVPYSQTLNFSDLQAQYAYRLMRNNLFMNTLDGLDQAQLGKVAARVTKPLP
jgi:hypothetical protein